MNRVVRGGQDCHEGGSSGVQGDWSLDGALMGEEKNGQDEHVCTAWRKAKGSRRVRLKNGHPGETYLDSREGEESPDNELLTRRF